MRFEQLHPRTSAFAPYLAYIWQIRQSDRRHLAYIWQVIPERPQLEGTQLPPKLLVVKNQLPYISEIRPDELQNLPYISEIAPTKRYERSRSPSVRRNSIRLRCLTPSRCIGSGSKLNRYFGYPSASFVNGRNSRSSTLGSCTLIDTCT